MDFSILQRKNPKFTKMQFIVFKCKQISYIERNLAKIFVCFGFTLYAALFNIMASMKDDLTADGSISLLRETFPSFSQTIAFKKVILKKRL